LKLSQKYHPDKIPYLKDNEGTQKSICFSFVDEAFIYFGKKRTELSDSEKVNLQNYEIAHKLFNNSPNKWPKTHQEFTDFCQTCIKKSDSIQQEIDKKKKEEEDIKVREKTDSEAKKKAENEAKMEEYRQVARKKAEEEAVAGKEAKVTAVAQILQPTESLTLESTSSPVTNTFQLTETATMPATTSVPPPPAIPVPPSQPKRSSPSIATKPLPPPPSKFNVNDIVGGGTKLHNYIILEKTYYPEKNEWNYLVGLQSDPQNDKIYVPEEKLIAHITQDSPSPPVKFKTNLKNEQEIKVLSWNISWEAMTAKVGTFGEKCSQNSCIEVVSNFIHKYSPFDFIALQEATNYENITNNSNYLHTILNEFRNVPGKEDMVTFYNKKYELDDGINKINSYMENAGRSMQILFFKNKLCFINAHAGHGGDIYKLQQHIIDTLIGNKTYEDKLSEYVTFNDTSRLLSQEEQQNVSDKLKTYHLIIAGDFNDNLDYIKINDQFTKKINGDSFKFYDKKFYGLTRKPTCCDKTLEAKKFKYYYDHVITTSENISIGVYNVANASDHLPIIATIIIPKKSLTKDQTGGSKYYYKYQKYKMKYTQLKN